MTDTATQTEVPDAGSFTALRVQATWMRGGTSKCWVFHADRLPSDPAARDSVVLRLFGSPDLRQIDGVGGGSSTTSKAMVIHTDTMRPGYIEYEVGQVSIDSARVEWDSNCGNCAAAVALYVVQEGLVPITAPTTEFTIVNRRSGLILEAAIATPDPKVAPESGNEVVPGTTFPGVRVVLRWSPPSWSEFGTTLPTGHPVDVVEVDGKRIASTIIDAGSPTALVKASDLGLDESDLSREQMHKHLPWLMKFRAAAAQLMNLPTSDLQSIPKVGIVGRAGDGARSHVEARMASMTELHPAIGITSAVAVAAAAHIDGTTVKDVLSIPVPPGEGHCEFSVGTLAGSVSLDVERDETGQARAIDSIRSARRLADAIIHLGGDWAEIKGL